MHNSVFHKDAYQITKNSFKSGGCHYITNSVPGFKGKVGGSLTGERSGVPDFLRTFKEDLEVFYI